MNKPPAAQFYWNEYLRDTRILTPASRGLWADMLGFMWYSKPRGILMGTYDQFARMLSCTTPEAQSAIQELNVTKVADVTLGNGDGNGLVTVLNRRMYREDKARESTRKRVSRFRNAVIKPESNAESNDNVTGLSSSSSSKEKKKEKKILSDDEWLKTLEDNPIYEGIEVRVIYGKMLVWCENNGKKPTRRRFVNWLNREEKPLKGGNGKNRSQKQKSPYESCKRCGSEYLRTETIEIKGIVYCPKCPEARTEIDRAAAEGMQRVGDILSRVGASP